MRGVKLQKARRNRVRFDRLIDRGENDYIASHVNNDAGSGKAGDNFVFALLSLGEAGGSKKDK